MNNIKIREGCKKNFNVDIPNVGTIEFECGVWRDMPTSELWSKMLWCPLCAEKIIKELDSQTAQNGKEER